jgi:hypothetical protein
MLQRVPILRVFHEEWARYLSIRAFWDPTENLAEPSKFVLQQGESAGC